VLSIVLLVFYLPSSYTDLGAAIQYVPEFVLQYGQGTNGSFYMYPIPSQAYQMEWDAIVCRRTLITDLSVEAIPDPGPMRLRIGAGTFCYLINPKL